MIKKLLCIIAIVLLEGCAKDKIKEVDTTPFITADCPDTVKFATQIMPIIIENCINCHGEGGPNSPLIKDYATISQNADKILKSIKAEGLLLMPDGGPALENSLIQKISCWIQQGKLNN